MTLPQMPPSRLPLRHRLVLALLYPFLFMAILPKQACFQFTEGY